MMRALILSSVYCLLILIGCNNKQPQDLIGQWQVVGIVINGTSYDSTATKSWFYTFHATRQYAAHLSEPDTGEYIAGVNAVTLISAKNTNAQKTIFQISRLDSLRLDMQSTDSNRIVLNLKKISDHP